MVRGCCPLPADGQMSFPGSMSVLYSRYRVRTPVRTGIAAEGAVCLYSALVTGGSRGMGLAIAKELGTHGCRVAVMATRTEENYPEAVRVLRGAGVEYIWLAGDVSRSDDRVRVMEETVRQFGELHILVNNAGVMARERCDLLDITEENYDYVMGINTKGPMFMSQMAARQMLKQPLRGRKRGTIINIASCNSEVSSIRRGEYCISKAGVSMVTKLFADRLAPEAVYVYEIRPGVIKTDMNLKVRDMYEKMAADGLFPIPRLGEPEDVARAVRALCSEDFCYSTGTVIDVDGGFHIRRM